MNDILVAVPVYNKKDCLTATLESIGNQTFPVDVLLVDDGSTDGSLQIEEESLGNYSYFKLIKLEHSGIGKARDFILHYALKHGYKYLSYVDADDIIEPTFIETLITPMLQDQSISISVAAMKGYYEHLLLPEKTYNPEDFYCQLRPYATLVISRIYRLTDQLNSINFPFINTAEDLATNYKILFNSSKVYFTPQTLYNYLTEHNSSSVELNKIERYILRASIYYTQYAYFTHHNYNKAKIIAFTTFLGYIEEIAKLKQIPTVLIWALFNFITSELAQHSDEVDLAYGDILEDYNKIADFLKKGESECTDL